MKTKEIRADVGVLVGRFQVPNLHPGHIELIQSVCETHPKVIIFLGLAPTKATRNNPLDFESRKQMILEKFPNVIVLYIKDIKSDEIWSTRLDQQILDVIGPEQTVVLYGSRDSFISHYSGRFKCIELLQERFVSGSDIRKEISRSVMNTPEFRAGVIWATHNQYRKVYTTVDIAIFSADGKSLLLARKPDEDLYRFVGGFSEPDSPSFEDDAAREVREETGIEVSSMEYINSYVVEDWRYKNEVDKIKTIFFATTYVFGRPTPQDDIEELRWFPLEMLDGSNMVNCHKTLLLGLKHFLMEERSQIFRKRFIDASPERDQNQDNK